MHKILIINCSNGKSRISTENGFIEFQLLCVFFGKECAWLLVLYWKQTEALQAPDNNAEEVSAFVEADHGDRCIMMWVRIH